MTAAPHHPSPTNPLVGRDREVDALRHHLGTALDGHGSLVLIGGEAGIGKTTLAEGACAEAARRGALVLVGRCYDLAETPPYGPWSEAFALAPSDDDLPTLPAAVLPPERGGEDMTSTDAIVRRVRAYLAALIARQPTVLLLEDLHWADPASLDLLRVVGRNLAAGPLLLLATYRDDEPGEGRPLNALLPVLVREARADRLALPPLGDAATRALARARYGLPLADEARLAAHLQERAEGNPLYLGELLRALEEAGTLHPTPERDRWRLGDLTSAHVPPLLRQIIGTRAARLGAESGRLLALAAVIGQTVPLDLWVQVAEADEEALAQTVGQAVAARVLAETPDGAGVHFAHALVREALYEGIPLPRRRALHRRVADALLAHSSPDPDIVANHLQRAGDPRAIDWLIQAGHRAQTSFAFPMAIGRYEAALALLADGAPEPARRGWVLLYIAQAYYYGDSSGNIARLREAIRLASLAHDRVLDAAATYRLGFHLTALGDFRRGMAGMTASLATLEELTPDERAWLAVAWGPEAEAYGPVAMRLAYLGDCAEARRLALLMQASAPDHRADYTLAEVHAIVGEPDEARRAYARGHTRGRERGFFPNVGLFAMFELHRNILQYYADDLRERRRAADESAHALAVVGEAHAIEHADFARLPLLVVEGQWEAARACAGAILATNRAYRPAVASLLTRVALAQGDVALVTAQVARWLPAGPAEEPGGTWYYEALWFQRGAAELALAAGEPAVARAWLEAHDRWLAWNGAVRGRAEGQVAWAAYHRAVGDHEAAQASAERGLAHASAPRQPLALLAAHRLLGELATAASSREEAQRHLDAALALADACVAPYERALTLLALAELRLVEGRQEAASAALGAADIVLVRLAARPALARSAALAARLVDTTPRPTSPPVAPPSPARLTAREVEVLRLVAAGKSNREMAAALCRSERTIERHVENIYRKIAARNRADATAFALRHHLA